MINLRIQLLVSHLGLAIIMLIVMVGAILSFYHLGGSIDRVVRANYASVIAAQRMKETLERQDSAATFLLAGQIQKARTQYEANAPQFEDAYHVEANNITESGEQQIADDIRRRFAKYTGDIRRLLYASPPLHTEAARSYYFGTLEPEFVSLKDRAQDVLNLNQEAIRRANGRARVEAQNATAIGIAATVLAFGLALFLAFGSVNAALAPLRSLARQAEEIGAGRWNQRIEVRRADEIGVLAGSFNRMAEQLRDAWRIEEERLQRAERMSDAALESLYDPVIVTDANERVVHLNRAAEGLFGPADQSVGVSAALVVKDERIAQAIARAVRQESVSAHEGDEGVVSLASSDSERAYRVRATPMRGENNELLGAAIVLEDVTHLRELDRLKTEFIGVASHELRTPVQSLLLSVQLLEEGAVGALSPEQSTVVQAQKDDLERLERMTRDLLDVTRLEAGIMPPRVEIEAPRDLAEASMKSAAPQAEAKGVHLVLEAGTDLPSIRADRSQVNRALVNLLNNAIRHSEKGGRVNLTVGASEKDVRFAVRDEGSGIPAEFVPRIFDRFVQVPGATRGGAGLGLSIVSSIARAHGGRVTVESELGEGSTFVLILPRSE